jgi:L-threonylcarbamoyladenylate synthase
LRPGGISRQRLEQLLGPLESPAASQHPAPALSPGLQPVHYAPAAPAFRFGVSDLTRLQNLFRSQLGRSNVLLIIDGTELATQLRESPIPINSGAIIVMPASADDYARRLYAAFREADEQRPSAIWVQQPPHETSWDAVRDRIARATRPVLDAS